MRALRYFSCGLLCCFLTGFLWLGTSTAAAGGVGLRHFTLNGQLLGWSADGRYAVFSDASEQLTEAEAPEGCRTPVARVLDTRLGSQARYLFDKSVIREMRRYYGEDPWETTPNIPKKCAAVPGPLALRTLLLGKALTSGVPDASLRFDFELTSKRPLRHRRSDGDLIFGITVAAMDQEPHVYSALVRFFVKRNGQMTSSIVVPIPDDINESTYLIKFSPVWAPDFRHVAIVHSWQANMKRDIVDDGIAILPASGPKIALVTAPAQLNQARQVLGELLHRAGHSLLSSEATSRKPPTVTRVLALEGHEAAAPAIAALIPGGASVEKQTERTSYHLTIELGRNTSLTTAQPAK